MLFKIERYQLSDNNLKKWVKFIWHFKADYGDVHNKLLPMDSVDIVINLGDDMIYETKMEQITAPKIHVNGLRDQHSFLHHKGEIDVWGISFFAYGLYPFSNKSLRCIKNQIIDLNVLSSALADKLRSAVEYGDKPSKVTNILESLNSELAVNDIVLKRAGIINEFMKNDEVPISVFCSNNAISQRTFERFVADMTGFSPVNLQRIKRYGDSSKQLIFRKSASISEIAYDYNYTDQAYFSKEFTKFTGVSPKAFRQEKNTVIENSSYV